MIRDVQMWQAWEDALIAGEPADLARNLRLYEAMYLHAVALGILPTKDPLDGIEDKIRWVRMLHVSATPRETGEGA